MAIINFLNKDLELFYRAGIFKFDPALLLDISDILTALDAIDSCDTFAKVVVENFSGYLYMKPSHWYITITINGVEPVGAIIFAYNDTDILDVNYIAHG